MLAYNQQGSSLMGIMKEHPSWKLVSDKVDADKNLKSSLADLCRNDIVIRLSIPHETLTKNLERTSVTLEQMTESKVKNRVAGVDEMSEWLKLTERKRQMVGTLNRLLADVCGDYWRGNRVLVVVPPGYADELAERCDFMVIRDSYPDDLSSDLVAFEVEELVKKAQAWVSEQDESPSWRAVNREFNLNRFCLTKGSSIPNLKKQIMET